MNGKYTLENIIKAIPILMSNEQVVHYFSIHSITHPTTIYHTPTTTC